MSKVAFVHNVNRGATERDTEYDSLNTIAAIQLIIEEKHDCFPIEATSDMQWVPRLVEYSPDIIFNTAEGYNGAAREAVYPAIFDQLDIPYSGPDATNLVMTLNKHLTKRIARGIPGLQIPESTIYRKDIEPTELRTGRNILKLLHEGSSIGMQIAETSEASCAAAAVMAKTYNDTVMIEEYVTGQDVSMAYVENLGTMGPAVVELPYGAFYDYCLKSERDLDVKIHAGLSNNQLVHSLVKVTQALVKRFDLRGYAKMDFRVSDDTIYLIEVNSQVSFHSDGEFALCCQTNGLSLSEVIHSIIKTGINTKRIPSLGVQI